MSNKRITHLFLTNPVVTNVPVPPQQNEVINTIRKTQEMRVVTAESTTSNTATKPAPAK